MTDRLLNEIRFILKFIALTLFIYVSYEIYNTEKAKKAVRESIEQIEEIILPEVDEAYGDDQW
tara:strand:+ start:182 stop:370 length:189 start_codon:yes stop_codon:yes gene_type:complete